MTPRRIGWGLVLAVAVAIGAALLIPHGSTAEPNPKPTLAGTILTGKPAPSFQLKDQFGRTVTPASLRGRAVILTFMESTCHELCPLVAETIRRTLQELGPNAKRVAVIAISTAPEDDTSATIRAFSKQHGLLYRWHYLTASRRALEGVWASYYIYAAPPGASVKLRDSHTSATYLLDPAGRERVLMGGAPGTADMIRDLRILIGLPVSSTAVSSVPAPDVGHPAPTVALRSLDGATVHLSDFRGKVVLLNFWATWCHPCRSEMPRLAGWYRSLRSKGLVIVGVDQEESASDVRAFIRSLHTPYPILLDEDGTIDARFNVSGLPTSFLINRQGVVAGVRPGILEESYLKTDVAPLVEGRQNG